jgi:hypothetical protein
MLNRIYSEYSDGEENHLSYHLGRLRELYTVEQLKRTMETSLGKLATNDIQGALDSWKAPVEDPYKKYILASVVDDLVSSVDAIEEQKRNPVHSVLYGFPSIDGPTGGMYPGELAVVVAGTGIGKSLILGQCAINAAKQGKRVLVVTIENPCKSYLHRIYSNISKVPYWKFKRAELDQSDMAAWLTAISKLPEGFHLDVIEFTSGCSTQDIYDYIRSVELPYDLLVVDQITNMHPTAQKDLKVQSWNWFSQIAIELKQLTGYAYNDKGVPILTASQASGGTVGKKQLTTDDVAMAKAILHHAHTGLFITKSDDGAEYSIGASKLRDAKIETFTVNPEFTYWTVREGFEDMGQKITHEDLARVVSEDRMRLKVSTPPPEYYSPPSRTPITQGDSLDGLR